MSPTQFRSHAHVEERPSSVPHLYQLPSHLQNKWEKWVLTAAMHTQGCPASLPNFSVRINDSLRQWSKISF